MSGKSPVVAMTDAGFATVLGAGKVRWTPIAGGNSTETTVENAIISSGSNTVVTQMAVSRDSEWLAVARYVTSTGSTAGVTTVSLLKLKGGDGTEIPLNTKETGASFSNISSLFVDSRKGNNKTVYIGDKSGVLFSCQITSTGLGSGQNAAPHVVAKNLGPITAITGLDGSIYAAINDGVSLVKIDPASGVQQDQWPMTAYPPIRRLAVHPTLKAVVVGARHRHLSLHSLDHSFESQTLACDDKPLQVDTNTHRQGGVHHFLCLTESGAVNIFKYSKPSKTPIQPAGTIKLDPSSTKGHSILSARFCGSNQILLAYGTHIKPVFKKITYVNAKSDEIAKESTVLSDETGLLLGNTAEPQTNGDATPTDKSKTPQRSKTKTVNADNVHVGSMKSEINSKLEELTFAERLGQPAAASNKTPEKTSAGKVGVAASSEGKIPKASSNVAVLSAALASNDRHQLQTVLDQQDQRVISATVKGLPLSSILPLLLELMSRFSRKPSANTASWLRHVLITHQAYLTSLPNLINRLSGLYNTLDDRLKYFPDLLRLHGRFELVLSHMELNKSVSADDTAPFNTYLEGADDEDFDDDDSEDSAEDDDDEFDDDDEDDDEDDGAGRKKDTMDVDSDEQDEKKSGSDDEDSDDDDDDEDSE